MEILKWRGLCSWEHDEKGRERFVYVEAKNYDEAAGKITKAMELVHGLSAEQFELCNVYNEREDDTEVIGFAIVHGARGVLLSKDFEHKTIAVDHDPLILYRENSREMVNWFRYQKKVLKVKDNIHRLPICLECGAEFSENHVCSIT